ncbi:MAG: leucine-rich repeat domain-containing protein [Deltaproteobacteria bacterium]|nr:leucine-rich repeat domain-containing protein [Deltaproteobacteria bacterium]
MARDEAYRNAEQKIEAARRTGAKELDLGPWDANLQRLTELPESLGQLTQLQSLNVSRNELTAVPEWLGLLTQLRSLNLSSNQLTALPEWLGQLAQLQSLDLSENQLTALPEWLGQLAQLQMLDLSFNQLTALPEWLGQLAQLQSLDLGNNQLTALPEWLGQLTQLQLLDLSFNQLTALPEWLGQLTQLQSLNLACNQLTALPEWLGQLTQLKELELWSNQLPELPDFTFDLKELVILSLSDNRLRSFPSRIGELRQLREIYAGGNEFESLPDAIANLRELRRLVLGGEGLAKGWTREPPMAGKVADLPLCIVQLIHLEDLNLDGNPLNPELAAAYEEGLDAVKRYLRAKAEAQVALNEAKLILIGEGEVGKSCLLGALRGDPWEEGRPTTHGIEIKPVKVTAPGSGTEITLNGWDFGGQRVYRPTHKLFFSAPAVYLVVWKPREGPQQGFVKEWIKLVKHREPEAKIIVVATHGGPKERQPDIDRQEIWDLFGKETVLDFFFVESRPRSYDEKRKRWVGERTGINDLKDAIARVAASLPEVGRSVPKRWEEIRTALKENVAAYLPLETVLKLCTDRKMDEEEAKDFIRVSHRLGHLIHYAHDPALRDIVVLKPDWLSTAMSYVLDDKQTRDSHGLVEFARLGEVWNDPARPAESRYDASLHPLFLRLMERFDLSYKVAVPAEPEDALGFWQRMGRLLGTAKKPPAELHYTSLIAQLVPDLRPSEPELAAVWPANLPDGDGQQVQICRIVETKNGQSATAEGLFYQLIVRLHKFSLGRVNYKESVHWQRGLVLDDDYNGRALLEHTGNDVRITVRAAYPEAFLAVLTREVKWLVESFWAGLRCDVMVPCIDPCGQKLPGTGLYEVQKLIESKRRRRPDYPCPVCNEWQSIDCLLRNAPAARRDPVTELLENFQSMKAELAVIRPLLLSQHGAVMRRFDTNEARILSRVDDAFAGLMRALVDEAKEGPRLFSLQPVERLAFNPNGWVKKKFRVTLWCEHTRLPLPLLNKHEKEGVYEFDVTREWFAKAAPFLKVLAGTLSLVLPVAASATKLALDEAAYKALENQLDFGKGCAEAMLSAGEKTTEWLAEKDGPEVERTGVIRADGGVLREFQAWLKEKDAGFGGLVRVQNKRQEFLWVHPQFANEY